ncbi:MAG: class I SAM-dependent methyltransferase [Actinomycetota bacterium]
MPRDWDAATYDRIADPMARWGAVVVGWLALEGDEIVLDAGCGSGRVTEVLLGRLPRGRVVALDGSPSMIRQARVRLGRFGDHVDFRVADLLRPLPLDEPVDAILSTATFHWIRDHDTLFRNLAAAAKPGAMLAAQCGGAGNIDSIAAALRGMGADPFGSKRFATPEDASERLGRAGFTEIECWLHPEPTPFASLEELATYLLTVVLGEHVDGLVPAEARSFALRVAERMPRLEIDYVRLNIRARRAADVR